MPEDVEDAVYFEPADEEEEVWAVLDRQGDPIGTIAKEGDTYQFCPTPSEMGDLIWMDEYQLDAIHRRLLLLNALDNVPEGVPVKYWQSLIMEIGEGLKAIERLNATKRSWLNDNRQAMEEFERIVTYYKQLLSRMDEFQVYLEGERGRDD